MTDRPKFFNRAGKPMESTVEWIEPENTVICTCNLAFFHTHAIDSSRDEAVIEASMEPEQ